MESNLPPSQCVKLNLTNFQAELNKQSRVLIVCAPFSLSEQHGPPLSHKMQRCGGTATSSCIVKMTLTSLACQRTQLPGLCLCQSAEERDLAELACGKNFVESTMTGSGCFLFLCSTQSQKHVNKRRETSKWGSCRTQLTVKLNLLLVFISVVCFSWRMSTATF